MNPPPATPRSSRLFSAPRILGLALLLLALPTALTASPPPLASAGAYVDGYIYDTLGQALKAVEVVVEAEDGSFQARVMASYSGRFNLRLPATATSYTFRLRRRGYLVLERTFQLSELGVLPGSTPKRPRVNFTLQARPDLERDLRPNDSVWPQASWDLYAEGLAAVADGRQQDAYDSFLAALDEAPRFPPAHAALALLYLQDRDYLAAANAAQAYLDDKDRYTESKFVREESQRILADALFALGECERALAVVDDVLVFAPSDINCLRGKYLCLREQGDEWRAEQVLLRMAETDSLATAAIMVYNLGAEHFARAEYDAAIVDFDSALRLDPQLKPASAGIAKANAMAQRPREALAAVRTWLEFAPNDLEALTLQADALTALARHDEAEAVLLRLAAVARQPSEGADPDLAKRLYLVGERAFHAGRLGQAIELFGLALAQDPGQILAQRGLILAHYEAGEPDKARAAARRLLRQAPGDAQAERMLAKAERALARQARSRPSLATE